MYGAERDPCHAATQAVCAGNSRGYHSEYGNSWFNNRESNDTYYMFRSYNNCYYSSSEPVSDEEDELLLHKVIYSWYNSREVNYKNKSISTFKGF